MNTLKSIVCLLLFVLFSNLVYAQQGVSINTTGAAANTKSMLDITSIGKGLLIPRMTWANRPTSPAAGENGLIFYCTDGNGTFGPGFYYYDAAVSLWRTFTFAGASSTGWNTTGNSSTNPSTNFLGTTDAQPLVIRTQGTERARFLSGTNELILGNGEASTTPTSGTLRAPNASGTNITGVNLSLTAGWGTGTAAGGSVFVTGGTSGGGSNGNVYVRGGLSSGFQGAVYINDNHTGTVSISTILTPGRFNVLGNSVIGNNSTPASFTNRANLGLTISTNSTATFSSNSDVNDANRMLSILNENNTANSMAILSFRSNPNGGANNQMLDMKLQNPNDGSSRLHFSFGPNGSFTDRFSFTSSGFMGINSATPAAALNIIHPNANTTPTKPAGNWAGIIENNQDASDARHGLNVVTRWGGTESRVFEAASYWNGSSQAHTPILTVFGNRTVAITNAGTTAATAGSYPLQIQRNSTTDVGIGSDVSFAYIQSWNTKPLLINSQGTNVGIGTTSAPIQTLDVNGRMNISNGVIQRGGATITGTSDLGLYSRVASNWVRYVTNGGDHVWFTDDGIGTTARMQLTSAGNLSVPTGWLKVGNPTAPNIPAGYDIIYQDDFEGDIFWTVDGGFGCGSTSTWYYALLTSGDLFSTAIAYAPSTSRSRRRYQSPSIWIPSYYTSFYVTLNSRTIGSFDEPEDGVWLEWKDEGVSGSGTTWTKITSFNSGGYGNITAGSNTSCNGSDSQSGWHMNDKGTDYGSIYDETTNISSIGRYIRIGLVGVEDNSVRDETFYCYDAVVYGNRPAFASTFDAGSIYSQGPIFASVQYRLGDLAEYFQVEAKSNPGELISIHPTQKDKFIKATKETEGLLMGVHSENPTVTLNSPAAGVPIALGGRVPVCVNNQNGPIHIGDYITISSTPGVGTKATQPCHVIGRALENFDGETGKIICLIQTGWANINARPSSTSGGSSKLLLGTDSLIVIDQSVQRSSRVFVSFRDFAGSEFKIGTIADGYFTLHVREPAKQEIQFDYFVDNANLTGARPNNSLASNVEIADEIAINFQPEIGESLEQKSSVKINGQLAGSVKHISKEDGPESKFPSNEVGKIEAIISYSSKTAPAPPDPDQVWFWTEDRGFFTMADVRNSKSKFAEVNRQRFTR